MRATIVAVVAALLAGSFACGNPLPATPHVYVEGSAQVGAPAASASIDVSYERVDRDAAAGGQAILATVSRLASELATHGVGSDDLQGTGITVTPSYAERDGERTFEGSLLKLRVTITVRDLTRYTGVVQALLRSQPSFLGGVDVHALDDRALELQAQALALEDARARAARLAFTLGMRLSAVHSVSEFETRSDQKWGLEPRRSVTSPEGGALSMPAVTLPAVDPNPLVTPQTVTARATVYVVWLLEPIPRGQ